MTYRALIAIVSIVAVLSASSTAWAQQPPQPPPPYWPAPRAFPYDARFAVPPGYHLESRRRSGLVITGAALLGGFYAFSLLAANNPGGRWNAIPIAGPLLYARQRDCPAPCDDFGTPIFALMASAGQAVGAGLLLGGLLSQRPWIVPDGQTVTLLPRIDGSGVGLAALGRF